MTFQNAGKLTWDALACRLQAKTQVLCVVNTRAGAQAVFQRLQGEDSFHLSTLMYPAHRRRQLAEIRRRLTLGLPCRVVSTSLIEAGVDVDFPAVYREEAGLDSLLQAAGRCNREGHRPGPGECGHVVSRGRQRPSPVCPGHRSRPLRDGTPHRPGLPRGDTRLLPGTPGPERDPGPGYPKHPPHHGGQSVPFPYRGGTVSPDRGPHRHRLYPPG